jgi:hypothetical protein
MNRNFILILILINFAFCLGAISPGTLNVLYREPSNANKALGSTPTGSVNIWNSSALSAYDNPAVTALHEGLSLGYTHTKYKTPGFYKIAYSAGIATLTHNKIGLIFPAPKAKHMGIRFDYGSQPLTGPNQEMLGEFESFDEATLWGGAIEVTNYLFPLDEVPRFIDNLDIAVGTCLIHVRSMLVPPVAKADVLNLGLMCIYGSKYRDLLGYQAVLGYSAVNIGKSNITYDSNGYKLKDPIPNPVSLGWAVGLTLEGDKFLNDIANQFFDSLVSFRFLNGIQSAKDINAKAVGYGAEFGLMDTIFFRKGFYDGDDRDWTGRTGGYGVKLSYNGIGSISYNESFNLIDDWDKREKPYDLNMTVNLLKLSELILK